MATKKKAAAKPAAKKPAAKPAAKKPAAASKPAASNASYKKRTPQEAAKHLTLYVKDKNADLGKKGAPSAFVQAAQRDMGGGLVADGIFGPKTKARAASLLGAPAASATKAAPADTTPIAAAAMLAPPAPAAAVKAGAAAAADDDSDDESGEADSGDDEVLTSSGFSQPPAPAMAALTAAVQPTPQFQPQVMTSMAPPSISTAGIPQDAKAEIVAALNEFRARTDTTRQDYTDLISQLSSQFAPALKGIADQLEVSALQRQATTEHNVLVKNDERWTKNNQAQQAILDKLAELIKVLTANNAISQKVYRTYGVHL